MKTTAAYYNEFDPNAAEYLRNLIAGGLIPPGEVDTRSIKEVSADDLEGFNQCHFFAGIGGWPLALRIAGWSDELPVWTGSCPCQPFSTAGKKTRQSDERHLWPDFARLIRKRRPPIVFGEQVDDAVAAGWTDEVFHDLEAEDYACAQAILPSISVGAGHKRERVYFVAHANGVRLQGPGRRIEPSSSAQEAYREADWFVDAVQRDALPYVCRRHNRLPRKLAEGLNKCFGNAIDPFLAAEFISSYMDTVEI